MHFWIDKRSQTCGFSGRHRIPSSLSAGNRSQTQPIDRGIWGGGSSHHNHHHHFRPTTSSQVQSSKPMVTPVHRFQSIESVASAASNSQQRFLRQQQPPAATYRTHHHPHPHPHHHHHHHHNYRQTDVLSPTTSNQNVLRNGLGSTMPNSSMPAAATPDSSTRNNGVYLDVPNIISDTIHGPQLVTPPMKVKCSSMWLSFGLLILFAGGARFYLSNQVSGHEVLVYAMLVVMLLAVTCYLGVCRTSQSWVVFEAMVQQQEQQLNNAVANVRAAANVVTATSGINTNRNYSTVNQLNQDDVIVSSSTNIQPPPPPPPPPPYHIAILLPQDNTVASINQQQIDESPPPSYDKVVS